MNDLNLRLPAILDLSSSNLADTFKKWRREIEVYLLASGATTKSEKTQKAIILHCAGSKVIELAPHFTYTDDEDEDSPDILLQKLQNYCEPKKNFVMESYRFWHIPWRE